MAEDPASTRHAFVGLTISIAAERVGMHPQTLREYERQGLVRPHRTPGGARRYRDEQLVRLQHIQRLTAEGLSLAGVRYVLELEDRLLEMTAKCTALEEELGRSTGTQLVPVRRSMSLELVHVPRARRSPRWRND
jgi:MerR family transcriptional regulator/heat shock protein HspR